MFVRRRTRSCDAQGRGERAAKSPPRSPRAILLPTLVPTRAASAARSPNSLPLKGGRGRRETSRPVKEAPAAAAARGRQRRRGDLQLLVVDVARGQQSTEPIERRQGR